MCQIHVITKESFDKNDDWLDHLAAAAQSNSDGFACLLIATNGEHSLIRSMTWEIIETALLLAENWDTAIIHQRFTTQGEPRVYNNHLWEVDKYYYCHNGILRDKEAAKYTVDSQLIGTHLQESVWKALELCQKESYANVIIVNSDTGDYVISRSKHGDLFTDGKGQYSSSRFSGVCDKAVPYNTIHFHEVDVEFIDSYYSYYNTYINSNAPTHLSYSCPVCESFNTFEKPTSVDIVCSVCESLYEVENKYDPYSGIVLYNHIETIADKKIKLEELEQAQINAAANDSTQEFYKLQRLMDAINYEASVDIPIDKEDVPSYDIPREILILEESLQETTDKYERQALQIELSKLYNQLDEEKRKKINENN